MIPPTYGTFSPRLAAVVIDVLLLWSLLSFLDYSGAAPALVLASDFLTSFASAAYSVIFHANGGQTVGKWCLGLRVVTTDGGRIGWRQAGLRSVPELAVDVLAAPFAGNRALAIAVGVVVMAWLVAEIATVQSNDRRRSLHDFLAGTMVVAGQPRRLRAEAHA